MLKQWAPTIVVTAATVAALIVYLQPADAPTQSKASATIPSVNHWVN
ncbi:MAG: hypothetical protein AAF704_17515 [Cyanobacteria bacterium P01_D01_bin.123]